MKYGHYIPSFSMGLFPNKYWIHVSTSLVWVYTFIHRIHMAFVFFQMGFNCIIYEYNARMVCMFFIKSYLVCNLFENHGPAGLQQAPGSPALESLVLNTSLTSRKWQGWLSLHCRCGIWSQQRLNVVREKAVWKADGIRGTGGDRYWGFVFARSLSALK